MVVEEHGSAARVRDLVVVRRAPRGGAAGPFLRQHRRQGSTGARGKRRRGVTPLAWSSGSRRRSAFRRVCAGAMQLSAGGLGLVRIVLDGCGLRKQFVPDGGQSRRPAPGVPGAGRSWVTGLL